MNGRNALKNILQVHLAEFKLATKPFRAIRRKLGPVLMTFEGGFLSIESGDATAVMRADGEWHGRATFSPEVLRAIALVPPPHDPMTISYADGYLLIGNMTIICQWNSLSQALIHDLQSPSMIDLLALERTLPRAEIAGTGLGKSIRQAKEKAERRIIKAVSYLEDLEVTEAEVRALVEARIKIRLSDDA